MNLFEKTCTLNTTYHTHLASPDTRSSIAGAASDTCRAHLLRMSIGHYILLRWQPLRCFDDGIGGNASNHSAHRALVRRVAHSAWIC